MSKTRMGKRVASLLLSLVMMLSLLPTTVYATEDTVGGTGEANGVIVGEANTSGDNTEGTVSCEDGQHIWTSSTTTDISVCSKCQTTKAIPAIQAVVPAGGVPEGYTLWTPGYTELYGNKCENDYTIDEAEKEFIVSRYKYNEKDAYIYFTAKVTVDGVEYQTVLDSGDSYLADFNGNGAVRCFYYLADGIIVRNLKDTVTTPSQTWVSVSTDYAGKVDLSTNDKTAYFVEGVGFVTSLDGVTADRVIVYECNTKPYTLTLCNLTYGIGAWCDVVIDPNGGSFAGYTEAYTAVSGMNKNQALSDEPVRDGYRFAGWAISFTPVKNVVTFTAQWADAGSGVITTDPVDKEGIIRVSVTGVPHDGDTEIHIGARADGSSTPKTVVDVDRQTLLAKNCDVTIETNVGTLVINAAAWASMAGNVGPDSHADLSIERSDNGKKYIITAMGDSNNIYPAGSEGSVTISVPYEGTNPVVYYVDGTTKTDMKATYENGVLTWVTNHFSEFVIEEASTAYVTVNGVGYATLADAIAAAKDGDTITLLADATEDVTINKNITLDLGGKTLTNTNAGKATVTIAKGATATVTIAKGATATVKNGSVEGGTSFYTIQNNGTATLEDVTATAGNTGSSMIDNFGDLTINSGTYTGGLNVVKSEEGSKLTITGGTFTLEYATNGYTGVVFAYGDTTISGGEFIQSIETTGRWNHPQVVVTGVVEGYTAITRVTGGHFVNKMSGESIFRGVGKGTSDNFEVSGGTFNKSVSDSFFKEGYFAQKNTDGTYGVGGPAVAKVNSAEGYNTLAEAIAAAKAGDTVTLLQNVTVDKPISVDKAITLDLGGKTLTSTWAMPSDASGADRYALVNNAKMTLTNGTFAAGQARAIGAYAGLTLNNVTVSQTLTGGHACVAFCKAGATYTIKSSTITGDYAVANFANNATISITSSTKLNGTTCGLYHNGSNYGLKLTVTNTTINGSLDGTIGNENDPSGVYISGSASHGTMQKATFTNCTIKGATAIEVKYTDLTLNKCTVEATVKTPSYDKNNNGMTALGFAVVSTDNSKDGVTPVPAGTVTIKGKGNYTGLVGLGALKSVKETYKDFADGTIKVSGGTFNSAVMPEYCADGYIPTKNGDDTYGVKEGQYVAQVGNVKYETLQAAIDAAKRNDTVKLLADTKENVTIKNAMTLDLNGFTLNGGTEKGKPALTVTARVTVKDSSEKQTGTIMREDTAETSGVSSHYVIDVQGDGWLTFEGGNVKNNSGNTEGKGASLVRVGDDSVAKYPGLNIKGGTFTQDNFIVIKVDRGDLFLNGGTLTSAASYAIENWHRATVKGGTVNGDVSSWTYSGGQNSDLSIEGGTVNGNVESVSYDGAEGKLAKVKITGGTVNGTLSTKRYDNVTAPTKDMATIAVTGGTFSSDPTKYVVESSKVTKNSEGKYGVEKAYLATVGDSSYYTMDEAFKAQTASKKPIVLLRDYTTGSPFRSGSIDRTVDLNGHTWTCTGTDANSAAFEINYSDVTLTVKNGKVVSSQLVGLIPSAMGGTIKYDNSNLLFDGVVMTTTATSGIETNGNNTNDTVTLKNSTLNVPKGFGIYFPSSGTLTINNSTINAKTMGVQVCAGSLSISGDQTAITVTGDAVPKTENDGAIQDGAAISIVNRAGYKGLGDVTVTGGTFKANGTNEAIKAYNWDNTNKVEKTFTANDKVAVSGGSFSSAVPEGLCKDGYISVANGDGTHTVKEGTYVAEYNGTKYTSLQEAIDAASQKNGGQTEVQLLCNLTINETVNFAKKYSAGSVLLNLGGYTLTGEGCRALQINKGNLYLENGTVTSTGIVNSSSVIRIGSNEEDYSGVSPLLHMRNGAKVLAPESYGVTIFGSKTVKEQLTVAGNASIEATGPSPAISGNGDKAYHVDGKGTEITITGNAVVSATNNYAIYHPDNGTLKIQGNASVTGKGGIQMCSGTLTISGSPKIEALGKADHETGAAGPIYDVAAISVVNRNYPGGAPVVTIKDTPIVTTVDGEVIHAYTWSSNAESDWADAGNNINVSGGTYSKTFNEAYLAADCTLVAGENGTYTVEQKPVAEYNGNKYISLSQAILDANNAGGTVKLLDNVTLTNSLGIGGTAKVTLNLNKKTLTLDGAQIYTQGGDAVIINNGTIKRIDTPTSGSANNFAIQVMSGSSLILGAGTGNTYKVTLESTYGIYNVGGTLTVRYATITTDGWSIAVSDSTSKTGEVYIGRGMSSNTKTMITSKSGNCIGTAVNSKPNVTIDFGTLTSNGTTWGAGVVYWASEGTLTITGGIFNASSAEGSEAAAVYQKNGTVKISGTTAKLLGSNALVVKSGEGSTGTMVTELSGGTYSTRPEDSWVIEGKEIHETTDGLYKVEGPYVVEVTFEDGTTTSYDAWSKLASVWNKTGATIKLLKDTTTSEIVATNGDITIDFNGKTLTVTKETSSSNYAAAIVVHSGGKLTLKDSSEAANGGMTATNVYGVEVITGSSVTVKSGSYNCDTSVVQVDNGTAYIEGGTFQTEDTDKSYLLNCKDETYQSKEAKIEVTGGTFVGYDPRNNKAEGEGTDFVAPGVGVNADADGNFVAKANMLVQLVDAEGNSVAAYDTLWEAFADAKDLQNTTLIVLQDITDSNPVYIDATNTTGSITLDLNDYNISFIENEWSGEHSGFNIQNATALDFIITGKGTITAAASNIAAIRVQSSSLSTKTTLTIEKDVTAIGHTGVMVDKYQTVAPGGNGITVNIAGTVKSVNNGIGVYVNGSITEQQPVINVMSTARIEADSWGMYLAGNNKTTVASGAQISGTGTGIEIRAGELTLNDCTVTGGSGELWANANGSGTTVGNAAVAVSQHNTNLPITVTVNGGTYTGTAAFYQSDGRTDTTGTSGEVKTSITRGTFLGQVAAETGVLVITGGSFSTNVTAYCAIDYQCNKPTEDEPLYTVTKKDANEIDVKRSLTLDNSLTMNYKVKLPTGYTSARVEFKFYNDYTKAFETATVTGVLNESTGRYEFAFTGINPQRMTDTLKATVYATNVDTKEETAFPVDDFSAAQYCNVLLASDYNKDGAYNELVGNLVAYGTAAQLYQKYHTDKLVSSVVTGGTVVQYPLTDVVEVNELTAVTGGVSIEKKSLVLSNAFAIRVKFALEGDTTINQVTFKVKADATTATISQFEKETLSDGTVYYYFDFAGLNSKQLGSTVTFTAMVDGNDNDVLAFSANTYLKLMSNVTGVSTELKNLLAALYNYGYTCGNFKA